MTEQLNQSKILYHFNNMEKIKLSKIENEKTENKNIDIYTEKIFIKNKKIIIWGSIDMGIKLLDSKDKNRSKIISKEKYILGVSLSHNEKKIAWYTPRSFKIWDLIAHKLIFSLESKTVMLKGLEYEKEGEYFEAHGIQFTQNDEKVLVWGSQILSLYNSKDGKLLYSYKGIYFSSGAFFSKDEKKLLAWGLNDIVLYDIDKEEALQAFTYSKSVNYLRGVIFNYDESKILAWGEEQIIQLWNTWDSKPLLTLKHEDEIKKAIFNKKSTKILSWDNEGILKLWNTQNNKELFRLKHEYGVKKATFDKNETKILSWDYTNTIRHWKILEDKLVDYSQIPKKLEFIDEFTLNSTHGIVIDKEEKNVFFWTGNNSLYLWNRKSNKEKLIFKDNEYIYNIISTDDKALAWSNAKKIKLWKKNGKVLTFNHDDTIFGTIFNDDATKILSWSGKSIRLWSVNSTVPLVVLKNNNGLVSDAILMKRKDAILYVDSEIKLYSMKDKKILFKIRNKEGVNEILLSKDEKKIIALNYDNTIAVWNIDNVDIPLLIAEYKYKYGDVEDRIIFNNDENKIVFFGVSGLITINSLDNNVSITLEHRLKVNGVQFNQDSTKLLSWSDDKTIKLWDLKTANPLHTFPHKYGVQKAILSKNEEKILSLDWKGTLILWSVSLEKPLIILKNIKDAQFSKNEKEIFTWSENAIKIYNICPASKIDKKYYPLKTQVETGAYLTSSGEVKALSKKEWEVKKKEYEKVLVKLKNEIPIK